MRKNAKYLVLLGLIILVALAWQLSSLVSKNDKQQTIEQITGQEQASITLTFNFADDQKVEFSYPYSATLSTDLLAIIQIVASQKNWDLETKDYGTMGTLVTKIDKQSNGTDQKYWQFFVNGEQPMVSADKFVPKPGDKIEWRFAVSKF